MHATTRLTTLLAISAANGDNPTTNNSEKPVESEPQTDTLGVDDYLQRLFGSAVTDKLDPMYVMANTFCLMSSNLDAQMDFFGRHVEDTSTEMAETRDGQSSLEIRVEALKTQKSDDVERALDAGIAANTRARYCEPFLIIFDEIPLVSEELLHGVISI